MVFTNHETRNTAFYRLLRPSGGEKGRLDLAARIVELIEDREPCFHRPADSHCAKPRLGVVLSALQYRRIREIRISPIIPKKFPGPSQLNLPP